MQKKAAQKIVIVGCGNVAWHIAKYLHSLKKYQLFVHNHKQNPALNDFRSELGCTIKTSLEGIIQDAGYYFICVSDRYIAAVAARIVVKKPGAVLLHTSGSTPLDALGDRIHGTGVFYPLQTFSRRDEVRWKEVPIIIESANEEAGKKIMDLGRKFSRRVVPLNGKSRLKLHLAAVLVNNFTNALYAAAYDLVGNMKQGDHNFDLLLPLIRQTTNKIERLNPLLAQTGPALRGDSAVIKKHLALLSKKEDLGKVYKQLSKLIANQKRS